MPSSRTINRLVTGALALLAFVSNGAALSAETPPSASPIKRLYIIHFSHDDVGFTYMPGVCRELQRRYIDIGLDGVLATMSEPTDEKLSWTCESMLAVDDWCQAAAPSRREEFLVALRCG
jgi:hypothetical protein